MSALRTTIGLCILSLLCGCQGSDAPTQDVAQEMAGSDWVAPGDETTTPQDVVSDLVQTDMGKDSAAPAFPCSDDHDELQGCQGGIECNSEKLAFLSNDCVACLYEGIVSCGLEHCPSYYASSCHADCVAVGARVPSRAPRGLALAGWPATVPRSDPCVGDLGRDQEHLLHQGPEEGAPSLLRPEQTGQ